MKNILVVGSINMDMTIHTERMPLLGETITGNGFFTAFGGKGVNQAAALAKQGADVKFIGAAGADANGEACINNLKNNGIEFCGEIVKNESTGAAVITVCRGDNCIILHEGANALVSSEMIKNKKSLYEWADIVVMQLEIPVQTVFESCKMAKDCGCITVLNPAPVKELPEEIYKYIDILIPNEHEAKAITGVECSDKTACEKAVEILKNKGVGEVIITLGDKGCAYSSKSGVELKAAHKIKAVDTTAAGDSFIGGLCSELEDLSSLENAVDYASKVSAITVSRNGASDSIPTKKEVDEYFDK